MLKTLKAYEVTNWKNYYGNKMIENKLELNDCTYIGPNKKVSKLGTQWKLEFAIV